MYSSLYLLARQVLAWTKSKSVNLVACCNPSSSECSKRPAWLSSPSDRDGVVSSSSGHSRSLFRSGD